MNHFSYDEYRLMLRKIQEHLPIIDYADVIRYDSKKYCVIRHDIEFSIDRAYQLALIENKLGLSTTYTVQLRNKTYNALSDKNIKLVREIQDMGHHIASHIHMGAFTDPDFVMNAPAYIIKDTETLMDYLGFEIDRFAFHRPKKEWLNLTGDDHAVFHDLLYLNNKPLINVYDKPFFTYGEKKADSVWYLSDSNHTWKYGDPLKEDLTTIDRMQLLCHPYSWTDTGYNNKDNMAHIVLEKMKEQSQSMSNEMLSFPPELLMDDHDYRVCKEQNCEECQGLVDYGIVMACDKCDMPGDQDADGWVLKDDGRVLCLACDEKEEDMKLIKEINTQEFDEIKEGKLDAIEGYYMVIASGSGLYEWNGEDWRYVQWLDWKDKLEWDWKPKEFYDRYKTNLK